METRRFRWCQARFDTAERLEKYAFMLLCAAGDCHGQLTLLYEGVEELEREIGRRVDLVLQVGDLGVWPDAKQIDKATVRHNGPGEFPAWFKRGAQMPRPTVFVAGNHEDFEFLTRRGTGEVLPGLTFLAWGDVITFEANGGSLRIGGVGGCYGPSDFEKERLTGRRRRHYAESDLDKLADNADAGIDVLLLHDAPAGRMVSMRDTRTKPYQRTSESEGLTDLIACVQPRICFHGHWHFRSERTVANVRTVGLNKIPHPGSMLLVEFSEDDGYLDDMAELAGQLGGHLSPNVTIDPHSEPPPDETVSEIVQVLNDWAVRVRGPTKPNRLQGTRLCGTQKMISHPRRRLLRCAIMDGDLRATIRASVPQAAVNDLLTWCRRGDLPDLNEARQHSAIEQAGAK